MGKKDKKKGKGAEKTAAKTEKKALQKAKKELAAKGENDIEMLIAEFQEKDKQNAFIGEERCLQPTPRSGFSLCSHPDKDELVIFGGEYFNGSKTEMYNDLYFYNIKKDHWSVLKCSIKPPPRCSHQAVSLSQDGGQMWIFGGEFASPSRSNFYHYKDLWVYRFSQKKWEQIKSPGGPSSRSGHRMVFNRKGLIVFGGFHESIRDFKYFNDVYIFDLENYQWCRIEPSGQGPCPRSGFQMASFTDGRVLLYGGYTKEKVKKDVEKGTVHTDMYYLVCDEKNSPPKWKWVSVKQSGVLPSPRCGFSIAVSANDRAFFFGGVHDEEDSEEQLKGIFYNDLYSLEMETGRWSLITFHSKTDNSERKKRRKVKDETQSEIEMEDCDLQHLNIANDDAPSEMEIKTYEDDVFTVKIGPNCSQSSEVIASPLDHNTSCEIFCPHSRMNASLVIKHSILYLYGGLYEDGDKQFTFSDFYSLDFHKFEEWNTIVASNLSELEWCESESSDEEESENTEDNESDDNKMCDLDSREDEAI